MKELISVYTPKQAARLDLFHTLLFKIDDAEKDLDSDNPLVLASPPGGKMKQIIIMPLDGNYIDIWKHRAFNLYYSELRIDPGLKEAAHVLFESFAEKRKKRETPTEALQEIWDRD